MTNATPDSTSIDNTGSSSQRHDPRLWQRPVPLGYGLGLVSFATIAAPLLAGFSLTAIVTLSTSVGRHGARSDIAIASFSISAVLMLFALQAGLAASQRGLSPDQRVSQYPEARRWLGPMQQVRLDQWRDYKLAKRLMQRTRWTYNLGIIAFMGGLIALLIPAPGKWDDANTGPLFRVVAIVVAIGALLVEIVLTFGVPKRLTQWLVPGLENTKSATSEDVPEMDPMDLKSCPKPGL